MLSFSVQIFQISFFDKNISKVSALTSTRYVFISENPAFISRQVLRVTQILKGVLAKEPSPEGILEMRITFFEHVFGLLGGSGFLGRARR